LHPAKSAHLSLLYGGNATFHCNGRFLTGPGARYFLGTGLVILIPGGVFIGTTCVWLSQMQSHGWWTLLVAGVLLALTLYYLVRASTSDPGIFLRLPQETAYKWHAISQEISLADGRAVQLRWCQACNIHRPPRCVHCNTCNNCVENFDHRQSQLRATVAAPAGSVRSLQSVG
jgi:palmitoyltransferase ZDHHC9/14/18